MNVNEIREKRDIIDGQDAVLSLFNLYKKVRRGYGRMHKKAHEKIEKQGEIM